MAQMYLVSYKAFLPDTTETGKLIVMATSAEVAGEMVPVYLDVPASVVSTEAKRIKGAFAVEKRSTPTQRDQQRMPVTGTYPTEDVDCYTIELRAVIHAHSEEAAMIKLGTSARQRAYGRTIADTAVDDFEVAVDCSKYRPRSPAIERQAIYKEHRFFPGGAARGR